MQTKNFEREKAMKALPGLFLLVATLTSASLAIFGCESTSSNVNTASNSSGTVNNSGSSPSPTTSSSSATPGVSPTCAPSSGYTCSDMFIYVAPNPSTTYPPTPKATLHEYMSNGSWASPCSLAYDASATDMFCIYEIEEEDLWAAGKTYTASPSLANDDRLFLTYNVPANSGCSYVEFEPFYFYQWKPGQGTTAFTETITSNGTSYTDDATDGVGTTFDTSTGVCTVTGHTVGPNCCVGPVQETVNNQVSGVTTVTNTSWNALQGISGCLSGPATDTNYWKLTDTDTLSYKYGYPVAGLTNVTLAGGSVNLTFPFQGGGAYNYNTNAFSGNYFDVESPPSSWETSTNWPVGMSGPGGNVAPGNPFYVVTCKNDAGDVLQRIRLLIRPWSNDTQYQAALNGDLVNGATPYWQYAGTEASPFTDEYILNFPGWNDNSSDNTTGTGGSQWGANYIWGNLFLPGGSFTTETTLYPQQYL